MQFPGGKGDKAIQYPEGLNHFTGLWRQAFLKIHSSTGAEIGVVVEKTILKAQAQVN